MQRRIVALALAGSAAVAAGKGNLYAAEVGFGRRAQKFRRMQ
jgi:hypothetical protein